MDMQIFAWLAAGLVFMSFFMKTIVPLRRMAIASNLAFITYALLGLHYGIFDKVLAIFILHIALLPLNIVRLNEVRNTMRSVQAAAEGSQTLDFLIPFMKLEVYPAGHYLFKKGDEADRMYLLKTGHIRMVDHAKLMPPGSVFGEVGIFSEHESRTSSALCEEKCELYSINRSKAIELFYQHPKFGFYIVRALARYVSEKSDPSPAEKATAI